MIKKITLLFLLLVSSGMLLAQDANESLITAKPRITDAGGADTTLKNQLTIKLNAGLLFNEQGLMLQYNIQNNFALLLGYGYNEDNSGNQNFNGTGGKGYTIRVGALQYLDAKKNWYFSLQGFYRYWGKITAVAQDTEGFTQGIDDEVINPLRQNIGSVSVGDGTRVDVYNASVSVVCVDAIWGYQYRHKHFVLDLFGGFGSRSKVINLSEMGYYNNPLDYSIGPFIPYPQIQNKIEYLTYLDAKLGFTLGWRIY